VAAKEKLIVDHRIRTLDSTKTEEPESIPAMGGGVRNEHSRTFTAQGSSAQPGIGNAYDLHGGASGRTLGGTKPATFALIDDIG
jgi:hypothetical protein